MTREETKQIIENLKQCNNFILELKDNKKLSEEQIKELDASSISFSVVGRILKIAMIEDTLRDIDINSPEISNFINSINNTLLIKSKLVI